MWEHNERMKGEDSHLPLADHNVLLKRRKEELRHAQDIKELYERKLEKVNDLYLELHAMKIQLEEREKVISRRERQISVVHYKKKSKPKSFGVKALGRYQTRSSRSLSAAGAGCRRSSPSTPEVLSTSPEAPNCKDDTDFGKPQFIATPLPSEIIASDVATTKIVVRENPLGGPAQRKAGFHLPSLMMHCSTNVAAVDGATGVDWGKIGLMHYANKNIIVRRRHTTIAVPQGGRVRGTPRTSRISSSGMTL